MCPFAFTAAPFTSASSAMRLARVASGLLGTALLAACSADRASTPVEPLFARAATSSPPTVTVHLGVFNRTAVDLAAVANGNYAAEGLSVQYLQVSSSTQQAQYLRDDQYDMVTTSPDNTANYALNEHNPLGAHLASRILMQTDNGASLSLVTPSAVTDLAQLRGQQLAVDAATSGFAYVLYAILQQHGLQPNTDYTVVPTGGSGARYAALQAGTVQGTLLNGGFEIRAEDAGYPIRATVASVANPYVGSVLAAKPAWLAAHGDVAVRFIRAYVRALAWVRDPAHRDSAITLLATQPNTPRALAEQLYASQLTTIGRDGALDRRGLYNVLALRQQFGGFEQPQNLHRLTTPAGGLIDLSYWRRAVLTDHDRRHD